MNIRPMTTDDLDVVVKMEEEIFPIPFSRSLFQKFMDQDAFYCWVVCAGKKVIGYLLYSVAAGEVDILNIAVSKRWRKKGVGTYLMKHLFKHSKSLGGEQVFLEVRPSNDVAIKFYEQFGFFQIGIRRGYYHDSGEDALVYSLSLSAGGGSASG